MNLEMNPSYNIQEPIVQKYIADVQHNIREI